MRAIPYLLPVLFLCACAKGGGEEAAAVKALLAANIAYDKALVDGDAPALQRFYHDEFEIVDDDGAIHDKQNQIEFMTQRVDLLHGKGENIEIEMLGPDAALLTGRFVSRYRMDGKEADSQERFTSLWVREGEDWRIRHEHTSSLPTQPAADNPG